MKRSQPAMKIALLGPSHPARGGIVHFNSRLAEAMRSRRNLTVDTLYWSKLYPRFLMPSSSRNRRDEENSSTFHREGLRILSYTNPLTWAKLIKHLRRGRYDMFITHWVHPVHAPVFLFLFAALKLLTKIKICLVVHNTLPHERFPGDAFLSRLIMNMSHRLIMHGQAEADRARQIGVDQKKMITAFHPVYDQFGLPSEAAESIRRDLGLRGMVLLFFGFIRPYKGLNLLLEAFQTIAPDYPDVSLLIVGESFHGRQGEENDKDRFLSSIHQDDPLLSRIVWINRYVPDEQVGRYFSAADVFVAPYLSVTQSGPLNIAYALDKPVIASDLPAFRDCVRDGESGYLFEAGNASDLADKIRRFMKAPLTAEKVRRCRRQFSWERYVDLAVGADRL
ncbi:MAG: glycosyltransferase [Smithella sp.]|nr:glycosyltransferase [Smithella sp.]